MDSSSFRLSESEKNDLVALLQRVIQFPTEDPPGREIDLAQFIRDTFTDWKIPVELDEFQPGRANVIARLKGTGSRPGLVFSAHMDTMPAGQGAWRFPPFEGRLSEGRIYGRGAADMKSGLATMMCAARRFANKDMHLQGDLIIAFSGGESSNCLGAKRMISVGALEGAGHLLVSEPSSLEVLVAEKGAWWVKAVATGKPGHLSGADGTTGTGHNAVFKLVDFINDFRHFKPTFQKHPILGEPTTNIGTISGGSAVNVTPDYAEAALDFRFVPGMSAEDMLKELQTLAGPEISFETMDLKPPVVTPVDHPFVEVCLEVCRSRLGHIGPPGGVAYYSDSAIFCPALDLPRVIIGPGELGMSGQRDEHVEVENLVAATEIYMRIVFDLLVR